jgi:hypothetical protein
VLGEGEASVVLAGGSKTGVAGCRTTAGLDCTGDEMGGLRTRLAFLGLLEGVTSWEELLTL